MADRFYTCGKICDQYDITTITSEATGHPAENMLDFNPDTYWQPTSTADQTIDIDLGEAKTVDNVILILYNYADNLETGGQSMVVYSDNNDNGSYTATTAANSVSDMHNLTGTNVYIQDPSLFTPATKRYWRIIFSSMTATMKIGCLLFVTQYDITQNHELPDEDGEEFQTTIFTSPGGREFSQINNLVPVRSFPFKYLLTGAGTGATDAGYLQEIHRDCYGRGYPLVWWDTTGSTPAAFGKLTKDKPKRVRIDYQYYEFGFELTEIPHRKAGAAY